VPNFIREETFLVCGRRSGGADRALLTLQRFSNTFTAVMKSFCVILFILSIEAGAQVRRLPSDSRTTTLLDQRTRVTEIQLQQAKTLLEIVEKGIVEGNIQSFVQQFDKQVFVNITRGQSGYFSADQAASLLQHYLSSRKILSFKFSRMNEKGLSPYATGRLIVLHRGTQESSQVYVSCSWIESKWVIGQFNIY
jgi:hypothetical protein